MTNEDQKTDPVPTTPQWKFYIAGVQHHQFRRILDELEEGERLNLVLEPTNKYDSNAVRILAGSTMIGYVPAIHSPTITAMITDASMNTMTCEIVKLDKSEKPWKMFQVVIEESMDKEIEE